MSADLGRESGRPTTFSIETRMHGNMLGTFPRPFRTWSSVPVRTQADPRNPLDDRVSGSVDRVYLGQFCTNRLRNA